MATGRIKTLQIRIKGVVQGVGFRPFVYRIATAHNLKGFVQNNSSGVSVEVEGDEDDLKEFLEDLRSKSPPIAKIKEIKSRKHAPVGYPLFSIRRSSFDERRDVLVSPDIATCDSCLAELLDPSDRRFHYPFINCTNCGPRFTISFDVPYDRPNTTMREFKMCELCQHEYDNPANRRFHAQPNACSDCGPYIELIESVKFCVRCKDNDAIREAARLLSEGRILAIKGLGGFHLACDATNHRAIERLRMRKSRYKRPFALMAGELNTVKDYCEVSPQEEKTLLSPRRPIVLLKKKLDIPGVSPGNKYIGFMLPYTPLHHLLFKMPDIPAALVMTSGNISEEPIEYRDDCHHSKLKDIADYFLTHNRKIHIRCDDSVTRVFDRGDIIIRRSRGYVPEPIELPFRSRHDILAFGAELKNTFCLTKGRYAFLSHYIGNLESLEVLQALEEGIQHFEHIFSIKPTVVAYDLHPEYLSTKYAKEILEGDQRLQGFAVQHHHAHIASCMAENGISGEVIGVAFDGLGYGTDGNLWGGEFIIAGYENFKRIAHLDYIPMPGGTQAIREPWRMAASYLWSIYGDGLDLLDIEFTNSLDIAKWDVLKNLIRYRINSPLTSGMGRLFDAVSAILGICRLSHYEGQAAIELEGVAREEPCPPYDYEYKDNIIKVDRIFIGIIEDLKNKRPLDFISARFHSTISDIIFDVCIKIKEKTGLSRVALSGGVFQNMLLLRQAIRGLSERNFDVYIQKRVSTNDGGISLGQAVIANSRIKGKVKNSKREVLTPKQV